MCVSSRCLLPHLECLSSLTGMILKTPWTMNSYHFQTTVWEGEGIGVTELAGPFISYYALGLERSSGVHWSSEP